MAQIDVQVKEKPTHYACTVKVTEGRRATRHQVTVKKDDYTRLTQDKVSPAHLVEASFRFLLEREPKESILRSFDLLDIGRYFPEYEQTIRKQLAEA